MSVCVCMRGVYQCVREVCVTVYERAVHHSVCESCISVCVCERELCISVCERAV